ncbi:MAG: hypothetical protein COV75_08265 [Candidatus Omnitrophica bacterium CG11_big_fil_rev_8_21_14_0_20_63_9]|nr:MAG: hypothetical protein COV75_08265 [Candidatus Omnitrophica bacterium CG11_big_fil_rev_8_21_14_0_20_63_9]
MTLDHLAIRVQQAALLGLIFLLPFSNAAIEIGFAFLLIGWSVQHLSARGWQESVWRVPRLRVLRIALVVFVGTCAASVAVSGYPLQSLRGLVTKWLEYLAFLVIVADVVWTDARIMPRILGTIAWSAFFVAFESIGQELFGRGPIRGIPLFHEDQIRYYGRMRGPYSNPIDLGTYLMVMLPILLASLARWKGLARRAGGMLSLVLMGCLIRTQAVGAWFGLSIGAGVMALARRQTRRLILVLGALLALGGAAYLARQGILDDTLLLQRPGAADRRVMWQAALGMIEDRPWLGHGLNTFMANYLTYWVGGERQPRYAHNCYLQMAAETGLIGLAAFLAVLACLLWSIWRGVRRSSGENQFALLAMWASLIAFLAQAGLDTNFYVMRQAALFWVLAGLALGLSQRLLSPSSSRAPQ